MGIKYKDPTTGQFKDISVKVADSLPIGTEVDYDGETVPTGWEQVDNPNDYSTTETRIGTWIDGKPLYRKVVTGIYETQVLFEILNVLKMVNMYGTIKTDTVVHQLGAYYSSDYYSGLQFNPSINTMKLFAADIYRNNEYTICLEYTKTTD